MAIGKGNDFKTRKKYAAGFGVLMELKADLPRIFDEKTMGSGEAKGFVMSGKITHVLGALAAEAAPKVGAVANITIRPNDSRLKIFEDLVKTNEARRFLLEGVVGDLTALEARWAHGAGDNRQITAVEIVSAPHVTFENPTPDDGPESGYLRLNLDGAPTTFDVFVDNEWIERELSFDEAVERLKTSYLNGGKFRVSQRILVPSRACAIQGQDELEYMLKQFRSEGLNSCMVRTFVPGTTDPRQVDVQLLNWPDDIEADGDNAGKTFDMPELRDTKRFAALRDGDVAAEMEIIPGYIVSLVGNPQDATKSVKHKFVEDIITKGLSDAQKGLYRSQDYGPAIAIRAVNEDGVTLGLTRPASRTEGKQYRNLMTIPTHNFPTADKIDFKTPVDSKVTESNAE